jgi:hypothetical protein
MPTLSKLFILLHADDILIVLESAEGLQHDLNEFRSYCIQWKVHVNVDKTKIMMHCKYAQTYVQMLSTVYQY